MDRRHFVKLLGISPLVALWEKLGLRIDFKTFVSRSKLNMLDKAKLGTLADKILRSFFCDCMEWVLPVFEDVFPKDNRVRRLIILNREYSEGKISYDAIADLRKEMWDFWQAISKVNRDFFLPRKGMDSQDVVEMVLCASANPITQENAKHLLALHRELVSKIELENEINWLEGGRICRDKSPEEIEKRAQKSLDRRIRSWQILRLTSYFTGTEETMMKDDPPREFVPVGLLFGVEEEYMDSAETGRRAEALAQQLGLERHPWPE